MKKHSLRAPLVVTAGEPAGIGPDLCLGLAERSGGSPLVVVADPEQLRRRAERLERDIHISEYQRGMAFDDSPTREKTLYVAPIDLPDKDVCGTVNPANSAALLDGLATAVNACSAGEFSALVTGPLQKSAINDAGIPFTGHTEFIAGLTGTANPVMLLAADEFRVALVSTHLPLRDVADAITRERIIAVLRILHHDLRERFSIENPQITVLGLNPHAGEGGHLGKEEQNIIEPALAELREEGMRLRGPLPADTAFTPAGGSADAYLAMYHDQGLPVLKYAGFGKAINVTLGLPIIRTSVDHGTALDIAGSGSADSGSMLAAISLAEKLVAK